MKPDRDPLDALRHSIHTLRRAVLIFGAIAVLAVAIAVGLFIRVNGATNDLDHGLTHLHHGLVELDRFNARLHEGLVAACETNGHPLRVAVRSQWRAQIKQSHNTRLYRLFFPTVPHDQLQRVIRRSRQRARAKIRSIPPVDCSKQFREPGR